MGIRNSTRPPRCGDFGVISVHSSGGTKVFYTYGTPQELYRDAAEIHPHRNLISCSGKLRDMTMHSRMR